MRHFHIFSRKWTVVLRHSRDLLLVEVTDYVNPSDFRDIILSVFRGFSHTLLSQYVDNSQWRIGDALSYARKLTERHHVEVRVVQSYVDGAGPDTNANTSVLNVAGLLTRELLDDTMRFGMTSLSNIMYGVHSVPKNWNVQLLEWNKDATRWFDLVAASDGHGLPDIVAQAKLICMTIDGHLVICLRDISQLDDVLSTLEGAAKRRGLHLDIRSATLQNSFPSVLTGS